MYTSQGYMTADDFRDWEESTDNGSITVDTANPPEWFDLYAPCAVEYCGVQHVDHEWVTVGRASGEAWACDRQS